MIKSLLISLILTIIIELIVAILLKIRSQKDIMLVILVNICTNPVVVYIVNLSLLLQSKILHISILAILEIFAFLVEGRLYKNYLENKTIKPYKLSLCTNLTSFSFGIFLNIVMGVVK